jgi:hypothetical protein
MPDMSSNDAEAHAGHYIHPHSHVWLARHGVPVLKPCTGRWFCMNCRQYFDGPRCYVLRDDSGWPVAVVPGIEPKCQPAQTSPRAPWHRVSCPGPIKVVWAETSQ